MIIKLFKRYRNFYWQIILFLLIAAVLGFWFKNGLMLAGGEEGIPLFNTHKYLILASHVWHNSNAGYPVALLLPRVPYAWASLFASRLGVEHMFIQAITFFVLAFTGVISMFYLCRDMVGKVFKKNELDLTAFLAAFFYFFNPYSMSQVWGRGMYAQYFTFAFAPLFLLLFIRGLKTKKLIYLALAIIANFIFSASYVVVTNVVVIWVPILVYFVFYLSSVWRKNELVKFSLLYFIILLTLWFTANAWWILPLVKVSNSVFAPALDSNFNLDTLIGISKNYTRPEHVVRLLQGFIFFTSGSYEGVYLSKIYRAMSWFIPLISTLSLFYFKRIKSLVFITALFFIGFFVSVGANPPFGDIFVWFFKRMSFLQAFRNPYEKAGIILMLAYSFLFALGLVFFSKSIASFFGKRHLFFRFATLSLITALIVCGFYVRPLWNGEFTGSWTKVPDYYKETDEWLNKQSGNFKIMQMPLTSGDGVRYDWQFPYQGIEPSEFLFTRSSIGRNVVFNKPYYNVLTQRLDVFYPEAFGPDPDISKSEFKSDEFWQELAKLNIRYIVFHNDWDEQFMGLKIKPFTDYLVKQRNIKLIKTFGELDIYKVEIPANVNEVYSPDTRIEVVSGSSTFYKLNVFDGKDKARIYLLQTFDQGWEAYVDGYKIGDHEIALGYANLWTINKEGNYELIIKYSPQDQVYLGWKITASTFLFLFSASFITIKWRRKTL